MKDIIIFLVCDKWFCFVPFQRRPTFLCSSKYRLRILFINLIIYLFIYIYIFTLTSGIYFQLSFDSVFQCKKNRQFSCFSVSKISAKMISTALTVTKCNNSAQYKFKIYSLSGLIKKERKKISCVCSFFPESPSTYL